jgi:hypothetical protein
MEIENHAISTECRWAYSPPCDFHSHRQRVGDAAFLFMLLVCLLHLLWLSTRTFLARLRAAIMQVTQT